MISMIAVSALFIYLSSPKQVKKINIVDPMSLWSKEIDSFIFGVVKPGQKLSDEDINAIKRAILRLPWVKRAEIYFKNGVLQIDIDEEPPQYCVFWNGLYYWVGENEYVLAATKSSCPFQTYLYVGKDSFYDVEESNGTSKVKETFSFEIELINDWLKKGNPIKEKPEIVITDYGTKLIYPHHKLIVYLGNSENSWKNFQRLFKIVRNPKRGIYDFRYSDLLVREERG